MSPPREIVQGQQIQAQVGFHLFMPENQQIPNLQKPQQYLKPKL